MPEPRPAFRCERPAFTFVVWHDRIEVEQGMATKKRTTLLLRDVSAVLASHAPHNLLVHTVDGKLEEFNLGPQRDAAQKAIVRLL